MLSEPAGEYLWGMPERIPRFTSTILKANAMTKNPLEQAKQKALMLAKQHLKIAIDFLEQGNTRLQPTELEVLLMHIDAARELLRETLQDTPLQLPPELEQPLVQQVQAQATHPPHEAEAHSPEPSHEGETASSLQKETSPAPAPPQTSMPAEVVPAPVDSQAIPQPPVVAPQLPKEELPISPVTPPVEPSARPTLADRFAGRTVLNENLARPVKPGASPALPPIPSLARAMSINDFRLFANELFAGQTDTLRELVQRIDGAENLPHALAVLQEYYHGSADNPALPDFIALIERRFSHQ